MRQVTRFPSLCPGSPFPAMLQTTKPSAIPNARRHSFNKKRFCSCADDSRYQAAVRGATQLGSEPGAPRDHSRDEEFDFHPASSHWIRILDRLQRATARLFAQLPRRVVRLSLLIIQSEGQDQSTCRGMRPLCIGA